MRDIKQMREDKVFLEKAEFNGSDACCLKFLEDNKHTNFGVVFKDDVCTIYLRDKATGQVTDKTQRWRSINEMLNAGWEVD